MLTAWQKVWREGAAPLLSVAGLEALDAALTADDSRLLQGATTSPPPLLCVQDWPCEAADPLAFTGWQGDGLETVGEVEEYFAKMCYEIDKAMGDPGGVRWLLNWIDETPRDEMVRSLLTEVKLALANRPAA